jgi:hypothetical protein
MRGAAHGSYTQDFNSLPSSGSGIWYDARTLQGWYATAYATSISEDSLTCFAWNTNNKANGFFSFETENGNPSNRGLGAKNYDRDSYCQFGVAFTNECRYAVTNLSVAFSAWQFRKGAAYTTLCFQYRKTSAVQPLDDHIGWNDFNALNYTSTVKESADKMEPVSTNLVDNIAFTGDNAVQPGEVIMLKWYVDWINNGVPLGIDDLEVKWECAWPRQTVIILQ